MVFTVIIINPMEIENKEKVNYEKFKNIIIKFSETKNLSHELSAESLKALYEYNNLILKKEKLKNELILLNEKQQILFFASNNIYQEKKMEAAMKHSIFKKLFYLD